MELQGQRRGNLDYLLHYAEKLKIQKSMMHWFWIEFIFSFLYLASIISQLVQNSHSNDDEEVSFFIF